MRVAFGACEFDSLRHELLRHGRLTPLSPKAFRLLEILLDRRPEALSKGELLDCLWPETSVSDASERTMAIPFHARLARASARLQAHKGTEQAAGLIEAVATHC